MKTAENLDRQPSNAPKLVTPAQAESQMLADLTEWFCGFGIEHAEAERKALAWIRGEE